MKMNVLFKSHNCVIFRTNYLKGCDTVKLPACLRCRVDY